MKRPTEFFRRSIPYDSIASFTFSINDEFQGLFDDAAIGYTIGGLLGLTGTANCIALKTYNLRYLGPSVLVLLYGAIMDGVVLHANKVQTYKMGEWKLYTGPNNSYPH